MQRRLLLCGAAGFLGAGPFGSSGALRTGGTFAADVARRVALIPSYGCVLAISHAILPWLFQTLNSHRRNSAVFSPLPICLTTELRAKLMTSFGGEPQRFDA